MGKFRRPAALRWCFAAVGDRPAFFLDAVRSRRLAAEFFPPRDLADKIVQPGGGTDIPGYGGGP
jgi:hypothetical protein